MNNMGPFNNQNLNSNGMGSSSLNQSPVPIPKKKSKKNKNKKLAIIGIVLVLVIVLGVIVGIKVFGNKEDKTNNPNNQVNENPNIEVKFKDYTFLVPKTINYETSNDLLTLSNNRWSVSIGMLDGNYVNLKKNMDVIQNNFQDKEYKVSKGDIRIYEGIEYLVYELTSSNNKNALAVYTKLDDDTVLYLSVGNVLNQFDYELLKEITPIISSVKLK